MKGVRVFLQISLAAIIALLFVQSWRRSLTYQSMEKYCSAVVAEVPHAWTLQNNLGKALRKNGDLAQAIACYEQSLADNPGFVEARVNLGNALAAIGDFSSGSRIF